MIRVGLNLFFKLKVSKAWQEITHLKTIMYLIKLVGRPVDHVRALLFDFVSCW